MIHRGEIYWINFNPTLGSEIKKIRPAVIISNNQANQYSDLVTIVPVTSKADRIYPWDVPVEKGMGGLKENGKINASQIRTVSKKRIIRGPLGPLLSIDVIHRLEAAIKIHLSFE